VAADDRDADFVRGRIELIDNRIERGFVGKEDRDGEPAWFATRGSDVVTGDMGPNSADSFCGQRDGISVNDE
jgi:hypothetical protein